MKDGLADMLQSTVTVPYPGTPLYKQAVENDWLRFAPDDYEKFDMTAPVFKTPDMTPEEIVKLCNSIYRTFPAALICVAVPQKHTDSRRCKIHR